jgi:hypothetical protein
MSKDTHNSWWLAGCASPQTHGAICAAQVVAYGAIQLQKCLHARHSTMQVPADTQAFDPWCCCCCCVTSNTPAQCVAVLLVLVMWLFARQCAA